MFYIGNEYWIADVPQQYYGSKVVYTLTVEDTLSNQLTLTDSVYIQYQNMLDTSIVGTGRMTSYNAPIYYYYYSWTRQIYLSKEVNPNNAQVVITKLAWEADYSSQAFVNQTCYIRLTDDSLYTSASYIDPVTSGAVNVWSGTLYASPGWCEITLTTPFVLPPNKNIEVIWHNEQGSYQNAVTWRNSSTAKQRAVYWGGNPWYTGSGSLSYDRPNARFVIEYSLLPYQVYDLALTTMVEPVNDESILCTPNYTSVKVDLANYGEYDYNFSLIPVTLSLQVTNPIQVSIDTIIRSGILASGQSQEIEITNSLPIMLSGRYDIKTWLTNAIDNVKYDDTLLYVYTSGRISLPIDENFSVNELPLAFTSKTDAGTSQWKVYQGQSPVDSTITPVFGSGIFGFIGQRGCLTRLSTRQLDLYGSSQPKLDFWYFHDTVPSQDYTDVLVTLDGGITYTELLKLKKYNPVRGWRYYTIPLANYMTETCVIITFESMIKSWEGGQYIDRIWISSEQDLAVSGIILPEMDVCDLQNKELQVVIENTQIPSIDFSLYPTGLQVEITGPTTASFTYPLTGRIDGGESDTFSINSNVNFIPGNYTIKAFLTTPIDNLTMNDTAKYMLNMLPVLSVTTVASSSQAQPVPAQIEINQRLIVRNTGNADIPAVKVILTVLQQGIPFATIEETLPNPLAAGDTAIYDFNNTYLVPWNNYSVITSAFMICDSAHVNAQSQSVQEYVDWIDLRLVEITNPVTGVVDHLGDAIHVEVSIRNITPNQDFSDVPVTAVIENAVGTVIKTVTESFSIDQDTILYYRFTEAYTVPDDTAYSITVYIESQDRYKDNDTLYLTRRTDKVGITTFDGQGISLSQNIPNPANNNTVIPYSIPSDGSVTFNVYSISGQVLYSQTVETTFGAHSIELNTSDLAAGLYFYSMEFKGQRLIKRMVIER
jgi:hypothetical protein